MWSGRHPEHRAAERGRETRVRTRGTDLFEHQETRGGTETVHGDGVQAARHLDVQHCSETRVATYRRRVLAGPCSLDGISEGESPADSALLPPGIEALIHQAQAQDGYWLRDSPVTSVGGLSAEQLANAGQVAAQAVREYAGATV